MILLNEVQLDKNKTGKIQFENQLIRQMLAEMHELRLTNLHLQNELQNSEDHGTVLQGRLNTVKEKYNYIKKQRN